VSDPSTESQRVGTPKEGSETRTTQTEEADNRSASEWASRSHNRQIRERYPDTYREDVHPGVRVRVRVTYQEDVHPGASTPPFMKYNTAKDPTKLGPQQSNADLATFTCQSG